MAFESDDVGPGADAPGAPCLLRRPTEAPPPLGPVADGPALQALRHESSLHAARAGTLWAGSLGRSVRLWAGRLTGRSRRRLTAALAGATIELAERCEQLTDRLMTQEEVTEDVATAFGEELARLRAEVLHLARLVAEQTGPTRDRTPGRRREPPLAGPDGGAVLRDKDRRGRGLEGRRRRRPHSGA